jgi:hypothetical protein
MAMAGTASAENKASKIVVLMRPPLREQPRRILAGGPEDVIGRPAGTIDRDAGFDRLKAVVTSVLAFRRLRRLTTEPAGRNTDFQVGAASTARG